MYSDLYEKTARLQWLLQKHQAQRYAERGAMSDPARGQGKILSLLKMQDSVSTKELSSILGIRVSSLNEMLAKLEKNGYIQREQSEDDRRVMIVKLTEKGRESEQSKPDFANIFSCLSEEEQFVFGQYLDRIITALEKEGGDDFDFIAAKMEAFREKFGDEMFEMMKKRQMHGWNRTRHEQHRKDRHAQPEQFGGEDSEETEPDS